MINTVISLYNDNKSYKIANEGKVINKIDNKKEYINFCSFYCIDLISDYD